jgi:hypothetical protein
MKTLRVSYSLLSAWERGQTDYCVKLYTHQETPKTEAMEDGIVWDTVQMEEIQKHKRTTPEFNSFSFSDPQTQLKLETPYNSHVELIAKLDVYDKPNITELKTGRRSALSYLSSKQLDIYALACHMNKLPVDKIIVIRYDQYNDEVDWAFKYMNKEVLDTARNYIDSLSADIYAYFEKINIL